MKSSIEQCLIDLHAKHGSITPELVIEAARNPESPLHDQFEWDVKKAAHEHWLDVARSLIRSVRVQIVNESRVLRAPYFVRDPRLPSTQQGYVAVQDVRGDADLARDTVADECARAASAFRRAQEVAAAVGVSDDVLALLTQTVSLSERLREANVAEKG